MKARLLVMALVAALTAACGDDESPTEPTTASSGGSLTTVTFAGTLDVGGSRFYSFTNAASGTVTALLASVTTVDTRVPAGVPLEIGVGVPAGTGCAATTTRIVGASLVSQMTASLASGVFCVRIADGGEMKRPITFALRFTHP